MLVVPGPGTREERPFLVEVASHFDEARLGTTILVEQ